MSTKPDVPAFTSPTKQVTVPEATTQPRLDDWNDTPNGRVSLMFTFVASAEPVLW
jgi:hypothetical protein